MPSSSAVKSASTSELTTREKASMKTTNFQTKPDADSERQPAITVSTVAGTGSHIYVVGISLVAAIGGFLFGFDSGVVNGTEHALSVAFGTQAAATGFAVASVLLGCAVGAFGAGTLAGRIGRRPAMLINAVLRSEEQTSNSSHVSESRMP